MGVHEPGVSAVNIVVTVSAVHVTTVAFITIFVPQPLTIQS